MKVSSSNTAMVRVRLLLYIFINPEKPVEKAITILYMNMMRTLKESERGYYEGKNEGEKKERVIICRVIQVGWDSEYILLYASMAGCLL